MKCLTTVSLIGVFAMLGCAVPAPKNAATEGLVLDLSVQTTTPEGVPWFHVTLRNVSRNTHFLVELKLLQIGSLRVKATDEEGRVYSFNCKVQPSGPVFAYGIMAPGEHLETVTSSMCHDLPRRRTYKAIAHYRYADGDDPPPPPPPLGVVSLEKELASKPVTFKLE
jgi:hypothetical protein